MPFVTGLEELAGGSEPDVVVEAASHEAVQQLSRRSLLGRGIATIVLSGGALCDDALRAASSSAPRRRAGRCSTCPPAASAGLDALKAACVAGVDEVTIAVTKPPAAWKGIPYVDAARESISAALREPRVLFDGSGA